MSHNSTTLTISETRDYLCPEHAARLFTAECWWAIVPGGDNHPNSFASSGDSSSFWSLVTATLSMGQPLGYTKVQDHLGRLTNKPHSDPELLLRQLIKPNVPQGKPDRNLINARAKYAGYDPEAMYQGKLAEYNALIQADEARINQVIQTILGQQKINPDDILAGQGDLVRQVEVLDEEGNVIDYEDQYIMGSEWLIPIDRIIEFGEKQLAFLAKNDKVPDTIFGSEAAIWESEIAELKRLVQHYDNDGAGEGSREIDNQLLSAMGMAAGMNSGK